MKMNKKTFLMMLTVSAVLTVGIISCKKETSTTSQAPAGKQSVAVYLNDDPIPNLLKVLVDIRYVEVKVDTGNTNYNDDYYDNDYDDDDDRQHHDQYGRWDTLSITPRVYDLLKLKNGVDTLIANGYANAGKITKVRITLGTNNVVWTDSTHSFPLTLCDNNPYLYVKIESNSFETLPNGQVRIRIDFDVAKSIEFENGVYCLKPKLKSYSDKTTGQIEGVVKPWQAHTLVKVYNATDTAYAIPEDDGEYKIKGLKPATYSVLFKAVLPYRDTTVSNVTVTAATKTSIPLITLYQ